jgi:hypothetical protein
MGAGGLNVAKGRVSGERRQLSPGKIRRDEGEIDAIDGTGPLAHIGKIRIVVRHRSHLEVTSDQTSGSAQAFRVADYDRAATGIQIAMPQTLHDDFGAHAGGVAHGDCDSRSRHSLFQFQPSKHLHTMGEGGAVPEGSGFRDHGYLSRAGGNRQRNAGLYLSQKAKACDIRHR